jgi:uncharacterized repeat protein (TIGR03803 family)
MAFLKLHRIFQLIRVPAMAAAIMLPALTAQAQTYNVLHNFRGSDGAVPFAGVTMDRAGNLYGTTTEGGNGHGNVFKLARSGSSWILSKLYTFKGGSDGSAPYARVVFGPDGTLYGTTTAGGGAACNGGCGTVFNLKPSGTVCKALTCPWTETVLYRFTGGSDGGVPLFGDLVFDHEGNLYGTTSEGGNTSGSCAPAGCGVVFELTPARGQWTETVLHKFSLDGIDGEYPASGVIFDHAGNLYGTTVSGGTNSAGAVYRLTNSGSGWVESTLYSFGTEGDEPFGGLVIDGSGNLFGSTALGGSGQSGVIFELTPSGGNWVFTLLYTFAAGCGGPENSLTLDAAGNLYGTAITDGQFLVGSVFELKPGSGGWTYVDLHDFNNGDFPSGNVIFDSGGNLYSTTEFGGSGGDGAVWKITP